MQIGILGSRSAFQRYPVGNLGRTNGRVDVAWSLDDADASPRLKLIWKEIDGPAVTSPNHKGFGSRLIERALAERLRGTVSLNYDSSGVICRIEAPLVQAAARNGSFK